MSTEIAMTARRRSRTTHKNNKPRGIFTQSWAERYNMDNPMNLKECPRVEFWADTKWEPYKEGIQQDIRRHLTTYGKDVSEWLEFRDRLGRRRRRVDLHSALFPRTQVLADVVDPWKRI